MQTVDVDHIAKILEKKGLLPSSAVSAMLVGSVARGWHNSGSDIDVYVVTADEWASPTDIPIPIQLEPPQIHTESFYDEDRRWEISFWMKRQIEQLLLRVSNDVDFAPVDILGFREELLLDRISHCLPVRGTEWIREQQTRIHTSAFGSILVRRSLDGLDDAIEDTVGQWDSGHMESAILSARRALGFAVDALLESHGEYGSRIPKWRPQRLQVSQQRIFTFGQYWELESMASFDAKDPQRWITQVLLTCQKISMNIKVS